MLDSWISSSPSGSSIVFNDVHSQNTQLEIISKEEGRYTVVKFVLLMNARGPIVLIPSAILAVTNAHDMYIFAGIMCSLLSGISTSDPVGHAPLAAESNSSSKRDLPMTGPYDA